MRRTKLCVTFLNAKIWTLTKLDLGQYGGECADRFEEYSSEGRCLAKVERSWSVQDKIGMDYKKWLLKRISLELMRKHSVQNTMVAKVVRKLLKIVFICVVGRMMCFSRSILKRGLIEIFGVEYFSKDLHRYLAGCSKQSSQSTIKLVGGKRVVPLDSISLLSFDRYKLSFTYHSSLPTELVKKHFESAERAARFENEGKKKGT